MTREDSMPVGTFFALMRKSIAVYEKYCQEVIKQWDLNCTSFQVIMFFANNPELNTARDLCQHWGMKTGIASVAIDQLTQAGLLERLRDPDDRRLQRLYLTERAEPLAEQGRAVQERYFLRIKGDMTEEEFQNYISLIAKLNDNIDQMAQE